MKKLLALLMALVFVFSFAACGSEDKKEDEKGTSASSEITPSTPLSATAAAEKAANDLFGKLKNATGEEVLEITGEYFDDIPISDKEVAMKFFESITSKLDYKIISSEQIDDTTVNVKINFTTVDAETAMGIYFTDMLSYAMSGGANASEEEIAIKSIELMTNAFNNPQVGTKNTESTVEVKLVDGKWTIDVNDDLFNIISGDLNGAMEKMQSEMQF